MFLIDAHPKVRTRALHVYWDIYTVCLWCFNNCDLLRIIDDHIIYMNSSINHIHLSLCIPLYQYYGIIYYVWSNYFRLPVSMGITFTTHKNQSGHVFTMVNYGGKKLGKWSHKILWLDKSVLIEALTVVIRFMMYRAYQTIQSS